MTGPDRAHDKSPSRAPARRISRTDMHAHYRGEALAACRAMQVDRDLQMVTARARFFDTTVAKRRAASHYARALEFALDPAERDVDAIAFELFDRHPYPRPAEWDGAA